MEHGQRGGLGLERLTTMDQPKQSERLRKLELPTCLRGVFEIENITFFEPE